MVLNVNHVNPALSALTLVHHPVNHVPLDMETPVIPLCVVFAVQELILI